MRRNVFLSTNRQRRRRPAGHWSGRLAPAPVVVPVIAVTCAIFLPWLFGHQSGARGDALRFTLPVWTFTRQEVLAGRFPAWDPTRLSGTPHAANPQTGVFYPLNWLLLPLKADLAIRVSVVVHVALGGTLLALFARRLRLSNAAAVLAGLAYVTGAFVSSRAYAGHVQILQTVAWAPLVLMAASGLALDGGTRWAGWLATATALSLVAGYPVFAAYSLMAAGLLFVGSVWRRPRWRQAILLGALAMALAVLATAPALWSFAQLVRQTTRTGGLPAEVASIGSLRPEYLPILVWPWFFGAAPLTTFVAGEPWFWHEIQVSAGFTVTALAVFGATRRWRTRPVQMLVLLAALSLLAAVGPLLPLYTALTQLVPLLQATRVPVRLLVIWALVVPVLAAVGFDELRSPATRHARRLFRVGLLVATLAAAAQGGLLLAARVATYGGVVQPTAITKLVVAHQVGLVNVMVSLIGFAALSVVWGTYVGGRSDGRFFAASAYLAILAELVVVGLPSIYNHQDSLANVRNRLGSQNLGVIAGADSRVAMDSPYAAYSNLGSVLGFRGVSSYDPVLLKRTTDLLRAPQGVADRWGNASNEISLPRDGGASFDVLGVGYRLEYQPTGARLIERTTQLPRLSLVSGGRVVTTPEASLAAVLTAGFDPRSEVVLEETPATLASASPARGADRIEIVAERPGYIRAEVDAPSGGYLVFSESYYPGWRADAGGRAVPLVPADHAVMAVQIGPGSSTITLRFTTPWLMPTLAVAGAGVLGMVILFAWRPATDRPGHWRSRWSRAGRRHRRPGRVG